MAVSLAGNSRYHRSRGKEMEAKETRKAYVSCRAVIVQGGGPRQGLLIIPFWKGAEFWHRTGSFYPQGSFPEIMNADCPVASSYRPGPQ